MGFEKGFTRLKWIPSEAILGFRNEVGAREQRNFL